MSEKQKVISKHIRLAYEKIKGHSIDSALEHLDIVLSLNPNNVEALHLKECAELEKSTMIENERYIDKHF